MNAQEIELVRIIREQLDIESGFGGCDTLDAELEMIEMIAREEGESLRLSKNEIDGIIENYHELVLTIK